jgi:phage terminase large subunit
VLIPGLATAKYIETMRERWGEDSEWYRVRVKGQFSDLSSDTPFNVTLLTAATMRWLSSWVTSADSLVLGVDVAGDGLKSDDFVVAPRRGMTIGELHQGFKGDATAQADHVLELAKQYRRGDELVTICFDAEGLAGWNFYQAIHALRDGNPWLQLKPVRTSKNAIRRPHMFKRISAEIVECGKRWLDAGGAIPTENKLLEELHAWRFFLEQERGQKGALIYVDKDDVKKKVGRSPDRADAVFLAIWPWGGDEDTTSDHVEAPAAVAVAVEERSADLGIVQALRPDWGKRPTDLYDDGDVDAVRPLGPWG